MTEDVPPEFYPAFREYYDDAVNRGVVNARAGQPILPIETTVWGLMKDAFAAGTRARRAEERQPSRMALSDYRAEPAQAGMPPYDLPVPKRVDWSKMAQGGSNWMRDISEKADQHLRMGPARTGKSSREDFQGAQDHAMQLQERPEPPVQPGTGMEHTGTVWDGWGAEEPAGQTGKFMAFRDRADSLDDAADAVEYFNGLKEGQHVRQPEDRSRPGGHRGRRRNRPAQ